MNKTLDVLIDSDFESKFVASTPSALKIMLSRSSEVEGLRNDYDSGTITSSDIRLFVDNLLRNNANFNTFPYQTALSAIAVMMEQRFSYFAEEYLLQLSSLVSSRFWMAARVARICVESRLRFAKNHDKSFILTPIISEGFSFSISPNHEDQLKENDQSVSRINIQVTHASA